MSANDPYKPSSYPPSKTALLLLDYQNVLVNMIQDPAMKGKVIESAKKQRRHCTLPDGYKPGPSTYQQNDRAVVLSA